MSTNWYGQPAWTPPDPRGGTPAFQPPPPGRTSGPRHSGEPAQHRAESWRPAAEGVPAEPSEPVRQRTGRADKNPWHWLLFVPVGLPLIPGLYNHLEPTMFGLPFFYWCQLAFAFLASLVITVVHLKAR